MVHIYRYDVPGAPARSERRASGALETAAAVADKNGDAVLGAERQVYLAVTVQIRGDDAPAAVAQIKRRILRAHEITLAVPMINRGIRRVIVRGHDVGFAVPIQVG